MTSQGDAPEASPPSRWRLIFGMDRRSLALFRIGLGVMLLSDLAKRALTLRLHYTGEGAFPREAALPLQPDSRLFHLYLLSDQPWVQAALFVVAGLLALMARDHLDAIGTTKVCLHTQKVGIGDWRGTMTSVSATGVN